LILKVEQELQNTVPNLTIKYHPDVTPDDLMEAAIECSLACSNPAICNDPANRAPFGERYGVASCYNILPVCGGAYTLTRITLTELVKEAESEEHFLNTLLPECLSLIADYMNERIRFIVEKSGFFESNFLVREGLISKDRFLPMFGVTGLAECVNTLMKDSGKIYGRDEEANDLGQKIMDRIQELVAGYEAAYSPLTNGHFLLHAQVGLDSDVGITSGVRIAIGDEPDSFSDHLRHCARFHRYFPTGVGDIFPIASNVKQNPAALLDVVKGAFSLGVQYMSFYSADTDLVRITGYLVKRSEMEKYRKHQPVLQNTTSLEQPATPQIIWNSERCAWHDKSSCEQNHPVQHSGRTGQPHLGFPSGVQYCLRLLPQSRNAATLQFLRSLRFSMPRRGTFHAEWPCCMGHEKVRFM
jgi:YjjI family glycine radical enzyme